jgi:hypothetical protein
MLCVSLGPRDTIGGSGVIRSAERAFPLMRTAHHDRCPASGGHRRVTGDEGMFVCCTAWLAFAGGLVGDTVI